MNLLVPASVQPRSLQKLGAHDLAQLLTGFHFSFWGLLVLLATLTASLVTAGLRTYDMFLIIGGAGGLAGGAWQLHCVTGLGDAWRKRTRDLLIVALLTLYLSLFYVMWRRVPMTLYLLAHALAFGAVLIVLLGVLCLPVAVLARAMERRHLAVQCLAFATVAVVLLFPPFGLVAQTLVAALQQGRNPFGVVQVWLERTPIPLTLLALLPFSLTLSLLWSAKDLIWQHLNAATPGQTTES